MISIASITRGTTPTLEFVLPFDASQLKEIWVSFKQGSYIVIDKAMNELAVDGKIVTVHLTQHETLVLSQKNTCAIQVRVLTLDDEALASQIITCAVGDILKDGVIQ